MPGKRVGTRVLAEYTSSKTPSVHFRQNTTSYTLRSIRTGRFKHIAPILLRIQCTRRFVKTLKFEIWFVHLFYEPLLTRYRFFFFGFPPPDVRVRVRFLFNIWVYRLWP